MKLVVITMARNEEKIIPHFIKHYSDIADKIIVVDHRSEDSTIKTAEKTAEELGVNLEIKLLANKGFNEDMKKSVFQSVSKACRDEFDVAIVVDTDEFWHFRKGHTRGAIEALWNVLGDNLAIKPEGYHMVSDSFPEYTGVKLVDIIKGGARDERFDKPGCFSTKLDLIAGPGMHWALHTIEIDSKLLKAKLIENSGLKLLHYKHLGLQHRIERVKDVANNLDEQGKEQLEKGVGAHPLAWTEDQLKEEYEQFKERMEVLDI